MKLILVIEDNIEVRENTAELLELSGYSVITANNGKVGFEKTVSRKPDVVICDVMMPETDGLGFFRLVKSKKATSNIPLIFFSAGSAPASVRKNIEQGADVYLRKPFTQEDLIIAVEKCLQDKPSTRK
jgi:CheY-like chemotaxis protein